MRILWPHRASAQEDYMARARNIKPGLFKNEILGVADPIYTLLFEGLWVLADREGRLEDRPLRIKAEVFPYRDGVNVDEMLSWLQANGFIVRYEADGKKCIAVCEFVKHQNPHKNESESELPAPVFVGASSEEIGSTRADSLSSDSLSSDSLKPADKPATTAKPSRPSAGLKTLKTYLAECEEQGVKPVPDDHAIRTFMAKAGICDEMQQLAWMRFREEHTTGTRKDKRQKDWPATFANSVKDRWYRLWFIQANGPAQWTTEGLQAKRVADAANEDQQEAA
ncbi:hypothetical protein [Delftia acidovorans]|uniref:hypothetical protein n=1 Tax=Delftia acidovorans TaxID=80866 RepID=UPI0030158BE9